MERPPFDVDHRLTGWTLFWALLELTSESPEELARLRASVTARCRERLAVETLSGQPTVAALRRLFRAAGCDPTRYRPSSEALLRRLLKGAEMPAIHPFVDVNNCLSAELAVPCCVMAEESLSPPFALRSGEEGESYESLRGPFNLAGKPLLCDEEGPLDAPITGSRRARVRAGARQMQVFKAPKPNVALETFLKLAPSAKERARKPWARRARTGQILAII